MPIVMLQQQTIMPFIMQQTVHMPPAIIVQRFCTMLQAILSSHEQVIFMPPVHFSILKVQRGTIIQLVEAGIPVGEPIVGLPMPGIDMPCIPIPVRSIIMLDIAIPLDPGHHGSRWPDASFASHRDSSTRIPVKLCRL